MADRTVTASLVARVDRYVTPMHAAQAATHGVTEELVDAARAEDKLGAAAKLAGKATDDLGGELSGAARDAERLDREIGDLNRSLVSLAGAFSVTGDRALFGDIRKQQSELRKLMNVRKLMGDAGDDGADAFRTSFVGRLGPLLARAPLSPPLLGALAIAAAAAAPLVGASVSAAVLGGVASGGIIGGLMLASKDPRVQQAGKAMADRVGEAFKTSTAPFIAPTIQALEMLGRTGVTAAAKMEPAFAELAPRVMTVTRALDEMVDRALPGVIDASIAGGKVIDAMAAKMPELGQTVGDSLEMISGGSDDAALAMKALVDIVEVGIASTAVTIRGLTEGFGALQKSSSWIMDTFGAVGPIIGGPLAVWAAGLDEVNKANDDAAHGAKATADMLAAMAAATSEAKVEANALKAAFDSLFGAQMNVDQATIGYYRSLSELRSTLRENGKTTSLNTEKGQQNRLAVLNQVQAIARLRDATIATTNDTIGANRVFQAQIGALEGVMRKAGFTERQIRDLTAAYRKVPAKAQTQVAAAGATAAKRQVDDFNFSARQIPSSKTVTVSARGVGGAIAQVQALRRELGRLTSAGVRVAGVTGAGGFTRRWGGITEHAQDGLLREAAVFAPKAPARYAFAEPATGGEAFIPRRGDPGRSVGILQRAAGWYGMQVGGRAGPVTNVTVVMPSTGIYADKMAAENFIVAAVDAAKRHGRL